MEYLEDKQKKRQAYYTGYKETPAPYIQSARAKLHSIVSSKQHIPLPQNMRQRRTGVSSPGATGFRHLRA